MTFTTPITPGRILDGKFELLELIGQGGMGSVWRARQMNLDREVAIKILRAQYSNNAGLVSRFHREARAAGRLRSRHVISIYDYGNALEGAYIVMKLSRGVSLGDQLYDLGTLPPARAIHIGAQILDALDEAHKNGITHRDLKPDNVLVERDYAGRDFALILDFGIAKLEGSETVETALGSIFGTPSYMSPEQCRGEPACARSDLYAVGVMLYEMLSGAPPFGDRRGPDVIEAHIHELPPDLHARCPTVSRVLGAFVMSLLEKDLHRRPESARAAMAELLAAEDPPGVVLEDTLRALAPAVDPAVTAPVAPAGTFRLEMVPSLNPAVRIPTALSPEEWQLVVRIRGTRTIPQLARDAGLSIAETTARLRPLVARGIVSLLEAPAP